MNDFLEQVIQKHLLSEIISTSHVSGGCINSAVKISTKESSYFLKWNKAELKQMFQAETEGLKILNNLSPVFSPQVIAQDQLGSKSYLLTEWIEKGRQTPDFWRVFGTNLAKQHKITSSRFGLDHDNYIGSLPQSNKTHNSWYDFFAVERINPQLKLASHKGLISNPIRNQFEILLGKLDQLIPEEPPALLHGDLWSGNFMINSSGEAAIFDPAVHYGHRETELAFTQLFGGFDQEFYHFYEKEYPLEPGFDQRVDIHNLYPLLVHVNLFGSSYLSGVIQTLNRFV
ncbi:Fructosamine-3-kinase [Ekhidna lutea]|uniref:Fructosamine-3-kinase n=1 Tax=Ekhidna lutea TaxID=447679 RepID=A0A239JLR4_EKHLU|nr:fructosamine kinase family protein [Ekhidna lutea]SNT06760.1 Fructosamine-3-kinase [Ekhidna lutea]